MHFWPVATTVMKSVSKPNNFFFFPLLFCEVPKLTTRLFSVKTENVHVAFNVQPVCRSIITHDDGIQAWKLWETSNANANANANNRWIHLDLCCNADRIKISTSPLALPSTGGHRHHLTHLF